MEDFQNGPENFNNDSNNQPSKKKPNIILDILIGIGISAITYALLWYFVKLSIVGILFILVVNVFLIVKFFRTAYTAAATIILVFITPVVFFLLLLGACAIRGPVIVPSASLMR